MIYCIYLTEDIGDVDLCKLHYNDIVLLVCGWYNPDNDLKYGIYFYTIDGIEVR